MEHHDVSANIIGKQFNLGNHFFSKQAEDIPAGDIAYNLLDKIDNAKREDLHAVTLLEIIGWDLYKIRTSNGEIGYTGGFHLYFD